MAPAPGPLPPLWEMWRECQAPDLNLIRPSCSNYSGSEPAGARSLSPLLRMALSEYPVPNKPPSFTTGVGQLGGEVGRVHFPSPLGCLMGLSWQCQVPGFLLMLPAPTPSTWDIHWESQVELYFWFWLWDHLLGCWLEVADGRNLNLTVLKLMGKKKKKPLSVTLLFK